MNTDRFSCIIKRALWLLVFLAASTAVAADRFDCSIKRGHQTMLSSVASRVHAGQEFTPTAQEVKDLGDLAGNLNKCAGGPQLPVVIAPEFKPGPRYVFMASGVEMIAIPFTLPARGTGYASAAEYGGAPALRIAKISTIPGDTVGGQIGNQVTLDFTLPAGLYYYNTVLQPGYPPTQSGFSVSFP